MFAPHSIYKVTLDGEPAEVNYLKVPYTESRAELALFERYVYALYDADVMLPYLVIDKEADADSRRVYLGIARHRNTVERPTYTDGGEYTDRDVFCYTVSQENWYVVQTQADAMSLAALHSNLEIRYWACVDKTALIPFMKGGLF